MRSSRRRQKYRKMPCTRCTRYLGRWREIQDGLSWMDSRFDGPKLLLASHFLPFLQYKISLLRISLLVFFGPFMAPFLELLDDIPFFLSTACFLGHTYNCIVIDIYMNPSSDLVSRHLRSLDAGSHPQNSLRKSSSYNIADKLQYVTNTHLLPQTYKLRSCSISGRPTLLLMERG